MRFYLLFCASLTLVCEGFTRDIPSQKEEKTLRGTSEDIEYSPYGLNFYLENMAKLRERTKDSWKYGFKTPTLHPRISCHETNSEGPCRRKRSIVIDAPRYVIKSQTKTEKTAHRRITRNRKIRRTCASGKFASVDKKTMKVTCDPHNTLNIKRKRSFSVKASIATAPVRPCPPGSYRNKLNECWIAMSSNV